jgi:hypothetical protein
MGTSREAPFHLTVPSYPRGILYGNNNEPHQSVVETSATQQYTVGTLYIDKRGNKFRYAKNASGAALVAAYMCSGSTIVDNCKEQAQGTSGTSVEVGDQEIVVDVTNASGITDDLYAEGTCLVNKSTGLGDIYTILACELLTTATARLLLEYPIRTAWAAGTEITLRLNPWMNVVVYPTTATDCPAGVPLVAVPASYYCWLQTAGVCPGIIDAGDSVTIGDVVGKPGTHGTPGGFGVPANDDTDAHWGTIRYASDAGEVSLIDLHLE